MPRSWDRKRGGVVCGLGCSEEERAGAWRARMRMTGREVGRRTQGQIITNRRPYKVPESQWLKHHPKVRGGVEGRGVTLKRGPSAVSLRLWPPDRQHQRHL